MALRDVKEYYSKMLMQYLEVEKDLADFEKGLTDGYITEEQLADAKEDLENIKGNLDRLSYILFLFNLPKDKKKKIKYKKTNESLIDYFENVHADENSVIDETIDFSNHLRKELENLK